MRYIPAVPKVLGLLGALACPACAWDVVTPSVHVDVQTILVPPPTYPARDDAFVTQKGHGESKVTRSPHDVVADLHLEDQTPGDVLVYSILIFNYPSHCEEGEDRLPEPGPCRGNGPADPRDGAIPAVQLSVSSWASSIVDAGGKATFDVDLANDVPTWTSPINGGPGLLNPEGAVLIVYVLDKGPLAPEGPLRDAQTSAMFGGCQGPPANGPLPCHAVALAQHLPPAS